MGGLPQDAEDDRASLAVTSAFFPSRLKCQKGVCVGLFLSHRMKRVAEELGLQKGGKRPSRVPAVAPGAGQAQGARKGGCRTRRAWAGAGSLLDVFTLRWLSGLARS